MDTAIIAVSFIVTILGIAYPILFQVVSRLDEKYSSILILDLFNKERERKIFKITLIISLFAILIYILKIPPLIQIEKLDFIINNSALIFLTLSTTSLIVSFFYFVEKILVYYTPTRFLKYLIKKHEEKEENFEHFKAISDILYDSIKEQNETIAITISDFLYTAFQKERKKNTTAPIEYPVSFYEVVYKSIEELANLKSKKLSFLEYRTVGGVWLFGELKDIKISEITYTWTWRNLVLAIKYERDDMVMHYWQNAHRYFSYQLQQIYPTYSDETNEIVNNEEIENREKERERFLEFQYALGGLLLYKNRYACIGRIFNYTTSIPPRYELLPKAMGEIFKRYIEFRDPYESKYSWISHLYSFPDLEGLNADYTIKRWILEYIGVLFIRQYSIHPHLITMKPLELPTIPKTQSEKKLWLDNIDYFKVIVEQVFSNKKLTKQTKLGFITKDWLTKQEKPHPIDLIDLYKKQIEDDFKKTEIEQEISLQKKVEFETSSVKIIKPTIKLYSPIMNPSLVREDFNNWFIHGERAVMDKSVFSDDIDAHHINFDSFLAGHISEKFKDGISETFFYTKSKTYLLEEKSIFPAIENLGLTSEYVIICFAQNLEWLKGTYAIEGLTMDSFNGIELIQFSASNYHLVGQSIFILKKSDLPNIIHIPIEKSEKEKYELNKIDDEIKLYSSIVDLHKNEVLFNELKPSHQNRDMIKSVLVNLTLKTEIRWKKNINNIMIKTFSKYRERGVADSINDIKRIE